MEVVEPLVSPRVCMESVPMIEVSDLTKRYPGRTAVDGLTFSVGRGEIVGFLGPNGAGKSTTMRILSSFLPATSGTARVAGFDVFHQPDDVRRRAPPFGCRTEACAHP